ncbi:MAG: PLP-dependent transferase [Thermomicrobiales bacterium]|nr:PLP-dependent transferase [Thermomicrobiales bacterium]
MIDDRGLTTRCVHAGETPDPTTGAHGVPLYQNVTYAFRSADHVEAMRAGEAPHFTYSPRGNPTARSLELKLADLEGAETSVAAASGMAAIAATLLTLVRGGGHIVASAELYEQTRDFLQCDLPQHGSSATLVDARDLAAVAAAIGPATRALYVEPFSNPALHVVNLPALGELARSREIPLIVDNTFLSPALLRPLEHGADLVLHSATKYLSGMGQTQGGFISGRRDLAEPVRETMLRLGGQMPPFAAWMLLAGVKTLPLRMERHSGNADRLARLLATDPAVAAVNYPGLETHPEHDVAARLVGVGPDRFGGMLSFTLRGGPPATRRFLNALEMCTIAVSLGDVATLVWPWAGRDLIRMSVGIEDAADLERDVRRGLAAADMPSRANALSEPTPAD